MSKLTAETITDADIKRLSRSLPRDHYAQQWCLDAVVPSCSHPHRQRNARRELAALINSQTETFK